MHKQLHCLKKYSANKLLKKTHTYKAFGIIFNSEIEIPEFYKYSKKHDVTICYGKVPVSFKNVIYTGFNYKISEKEFLINFNNSISFYVYNGKKIIIEASPKSDKNDIRAFLLSTVIGILLHQRGVLPIHSSGIEYNKKAVLFAGNPGAGKSTLAVALNKKYNFKIISDDITICKIYSNKPLFYSSFPSAKLWLDSLNMLEIANDKLPLIRKDLLKYRYNVINDYVQKAFAPSFIFYIDVYEKSEVSLNEITGIEKFNFLINNVFRNKMVKVIYAKKQFKISTLLANSVKCYIIKRPKETDSVNSLCELVKSTLCQ